MRAARAEVYLAQETLHKQLQEQLTGHVAEARRHAEAQIESAKAELTRESESAKQQIAQDSDRLAAEIAESILRRSAA
jgi:F0F1-type ATP synthase membrane subunit b/b'